MHDQLIPWSAVRTLIDIEWLPEVYEYIHNISNEDLIELRDELELKRKEDELYNMHPTKKKEATWGDQLKLVMIEIDYRRVNEIFIKRKH